VIVLRALHITVRAILVLACAFWVLIVLELVPPLVVSGLDGARGKLLHIWTLDRVGLFGGCHDSLQVVHEGYTDLIIFLLLTWAAVEVNRFLRRRIAAHGCG
jgi:hypothetical protein